MPALLDVRCLDENETVRVGMSLWALLPPVTVLERVLTEEDGRKHRYVHGYLTIQVQVPGRTPVLMSRLKMGLHFHSHLLSRWKAPADFLITISKDFNLSRLHGLFVANDAVELWHWNAHLLAVDTLHFLVLLLPFMLSSFLLTLLVFLLFPTWEVCLWLSLLSSLYSSPFSPTSL